MTAILQRLADDITDRAGIKVQLGPQPMDLQEPIVTLLYGGIREIERHYGEAERDPATVSIGAIAVLSARGDGPGVYLDMVTEKSLSLAIYLERPFSFVLNADGSSVMVKATRRSGGPPFFRNDDPGRADYTFEESYDLDLVFPYSLPAVPRPRMIIPEADLIEAGVEI